MENAIENIGISPDIEVTNHPDLMRQLDTKEISVGANWVAGSGAV